MNPLTGKTYPLPDTHDREGINDFLSKHPEKPVVVVQGLGFVGAVMSLVCANALTEEYAVMAVDLALPHSFWKIQSINEGIFPITASDPKIEQYFQQAKAKENLYATYDPEAYAKADVIIVDINLDVQKESDSKGELFSFDVNLQPFRKAIETIADHCKEDVLILIETTVPPGTCENIVYPILVEGLKNRGLSSEKLLVGHSYERVMPGPNYIDSIQNFYRVFSGIDQPSAEATEQFLRTIISTDEFPLTRLGNTNATEMAKVLENAYRAMNIAFAVEWTRFAEEAGVNLYEVVKAIRMRPTHQNLMLPNIGVGGYCLPKDPLMASWARKNIFGSEEALPQSEQGVRINDKMPLHAFAFLSKELSRAKITGKRTLILGVSYRSDVGDTRNSPVAPFFNCLAEDQFDITLHDPYVRYWEEFNLTVPEDLPSLLADQFHIVAFTTGHTEYKNNPQLIDLLLKQDQLFIFDAVGILSDTEIETLKKKHLVKVIGRGDI